ncbi:MAG: hypothetical protein WD045_08385 [Pirellulaceae bacterium]
MYKTQNNSRPNLNHTLNLNPTPQPQKLSLNLTLLLLLSFATASASADEPFRPEAGKFPPVEKAHAYRGEIVFIDHANRRGSIRVEGTGKFYRNDPHPFAMLPYGVIRYHGGPADLRDIPLGTVMHVKAFLPPDPKISAVPVLPVDNKEKDAGHYRGTGIFPAENHVLLLEDEPSHCLDQGLVWKLKEIDLNNHQGTIIASREAKSGGDSNATDEELTFDAATRIWRGRERITVADMIAEDVWPASGKKSLDGQDVLLGITWRPARGDGLSGAFTRFHISDIWLDDASIEHAAQLQTEAHKVFVRSRWMPAWVDSVEYGKFGRATVTATLFGGMDAALYAEFQKGEGAQMNASENTLKHPGGHYGPSHTASSGAIIDVTEATGEIPLGSSGIQIQFETDLIIEGLRPTRVVRVRPAGWPPMQVPREEYLFDGRGHEVRFPSPDIFPKY